MPTSGRGVEADVDEIKLKDSFAENTSKRTSSLAQAIKRRISATKFPIIPLDRSRSSSPTVQKRRDIYPTFTIEDWEANYNVSKSKDAYPVNISDDPNEDPKPEYDSGSDYGGLDPDRDDNRSLRSDLSETSERNYRLSVDSSMVQSGRAKFYKRLSLTDLKDGPNMNPKERVFLEAAERGDKHTMMRCLAPPLPVNVNCTDILGRSAIQIAVDNENVEIVELLLKQENVRIGDALLYSITEGVYKIVEMLINHPSITTEMLANDWSKIRLSGEESSDFDPNISPIILAAHCNEFEILQLFLSRGAYIDKPHSLSCACRQCTEGFHVDSLRYSLRRIHTYRALASPAWISLTSEDPILAAFKLSWELDRLARVENEFKDIYLELSDQCKKYTCDLLHQCRSTREVIAVLNRRSDEDEDEEDEDDNDDDPSRLTLSRLKLALKYNQKQFVAHPNCQQLLTSVWYEGLPVWRRRNALVKIIICLSIIIFMPVIALTYLLFPRTKVGRVLRSPFMKFIYHSASFGLFLVLLILASTRTEGSERQRRNQRAPAPTSVEWFIFFWVFGMVWSECKQLWEEGLYAYIRQWWNWLDFIMLSLYLCTFSLRVVGFALISSNNYGPQEIPRSQWPGNDPTLVAEGVFAVANVFSFARIIYLFQTNPHLGPLQISLGCMIIDIAKFLFIFFLVLTSFACGLNQLYSYYDPAGGECDSGGAIGRKAAGSCQAGSGSFNTLDVTFSTLFWSLFGISSPKSTELVEEHVFIETVGQGLFMAYHVMSIIVLINMLIAMMSNSFQRIEDHADQEWKFARSQLWMSYFDPGSTLPAPFNLIISPKAVAYFLGGCKDVLLFLCGFAIKKKTQVVKTINMDKGMLQNFEENCNFFLKGPNASNRCRQTRRYAEVMRRLVSRYIHQAKKEHRQDGVSEDDLLEIKQDISSLRYELREDRKREAARAYGQMDSIKKDILRLVRQKASPTEPSTLEKAHKVCHSLDPNDLHSFVQPPCSTCTSQIILGEGEEVNFQQKSNYRGGLQTQQSVDLGMLGRVPTGTPKVEVSVTPASSLPNNLTYSQGNLSGCLLAPQEMDYLRKEIVRSIRSDLRDILKDALCKALSPTAQQYSPYNYSPTPTPSSTPQLVMAVASTTDPLSNKSTSYSRAPTLEAAGSPLVSPTSGNLKVPQSSPAASCHQQQQQQQQQLQQVTSVESRNHISKIVSDHSSTPVLLCPPVKESEKRFRQMYTQI